MQFKEFRAQKTGKSIKTLFQNAREQLKEGQFDKALNIYEEILKENPEAAAAYMGIGKVHLRKGRLDEAENYFKGALHVTQKTAPVLAMLANVAHRRGDLEKALKLNQEALDVDPKFVRAALGMGKILFQLERYDDAQEMVITALKYNPNLNEADILLSRIMQKLGHSEQAINNLQKLLVRDAESWSAYFLQSKIYLQENKFDASIEAANKSLRFKPDNIRTLICLSQALIGKRQYIKAIDILTSLIKRNPGSWNAKMLLARAYFMNNDLEDVRRLLTKMTNGHRRLDLVHFMLGDVFAAQGLIQQSLEEYEAGVLHADDLIKKFPKLRELAVNEMVPDKKVSEFRQLLMEIRNQGELEMDASDDAA